MADEAKDQVAVKVGGRVEDEDHVPASTDIYAQLNTHSQGTVANDVHGPTPLFRAGRVQAVVDAVKHLAGEADGAFDRVVFSESNDNAAAVAGLKKHAAGLVANPVVVGGPSPAVAAAAEKSAK